MSFICIVCRDLLTNRPDGHGPGTTVDIISTKCGHMYHLHCLMEWFRRKTDVAHQNHECPYCCAVVTPNDILRIFPSEDEETEEIAARFNEAKANLVDKEISLLQSKLDDYKSKFEQEQQTHESLKFDHALKLSEIEQLKRDHEVDLSLLNAPQSNWKTMLDKERKSRSKILKTMTTLEKRFAKQKADTEKEHRRKSEESQKLTSELKSQNDSLRKKIERLSAQYQQQQQQPFRPVFPTTAAATPSTSINGPVSMSVISSSSSSQNRRRSAPNPPQAMIFCPNVTSSSQNQSTVYGMPTFRPPGASQSHFLNPPNPAQNPYQNLLSAAAAAASSTSNQNQSRSNPSINSNSNQNQQPPPSSTSTSSAQGHFQNSNPSSGGGNQPGFNNPNFPPSPFSLPQAHNHNHNSSHLHHAHPPPMHLSMHSPYYYPSSMSSRNQPYPPTPYSFPTPPHLSSASQIPNGGDVQAAHAQAETSSAAARAAARLLPAHMQFYMQTATAAGMTETVGVTAAYPSFLAPSIHPPTLSPRH